MRRPSSKVLKNRVDVYLNVSGPDNEGGPDFLFNQTPNYAQVPCSVQPMGSEIDDQHRITQFNRYRVIFGMVLPLSLRDVFVWIDTVGTRHLLFIEASWDMAGRGAAYSVPCVERI